MVKLIVLYPQPTDTETFEADYVKHAALLHEKGGIPVDVKPYTVTRFLSSPQEPSPYYIMFTMPFDSPEALQATMSSEEMQEVVADAYRISTGGPITILVGSDN